MGPFGAALAGGLVSAYATWRQADMNREWGSAEAGFNREFSADQARLNREWQERMSGSAHQREVADLRAAGLNPILSGTGGMGSATGPGAMGSGSMPSGSSPSFNDPVTPAIHTGLAAKRLETELEVMRSQSDKMKAEESVSKAQESAILAGMPGILSDNSAKSANATLQGLEASKQAILKRLYVEGEKVLKGVSVSSAAKAVRDFAHRDIPPPPVPGKQFILRN